MNKKKILFDTFLYFYLNVPVFLFTTVFEKKKNEQAKLNDGFVNYYTKIIITIREHQNEFPNILKKKNKQKELTKLVVHKLLNYKFFEK